MCGKSMIYTIAPLFPGSIGGIRPRPAFHRVPDSGWLAGSVGCWRPVFHLYSINSRLWQNSKTPRCLMCQDQPLWRSMLLIS